MRDQRDMEALAERRLQGIQQANEAARLALQRANEAARQRWGSIEDQLQGPPKPRPPARFLCDDYGLYLLRQRAFWNLRAGRKEAVTPLPLP